MNKKIIYILILLLLFPINVLAKEEKNVQDYQDPISSITKVEDDGKIHYYLFYSSTCPHCHSERNFISNSLKELYKDKVEFFEYDISVYDELYVSVCKYFNYKGGSVPLTIIGDKYYVGFGDSMKSVLINKIDSYLDDSHPTTFNIPIFGSIDAYTFSISTLGVFLGLLDGFNPCALWVLLFLINIMLTFKDRKKMFILGLCFLLTSGFVYFLAMLGVSFALNITAISWIQKLIGLCAITAGVLQVRKWIRTRKTNGCEVVNDKRRKKILTRLQRIAQEKNFILAMIGIIVLAVSVNLVELACSIGFPAIYSEILAMNNITGFMRALYILLYCIFYMLDDFIIFLITVVTLSVKGISNKYNKYVTIISGVIMLVMGLLLIFKPEWIMLNF